MSASDEVARLEDEVRELRAKVEAIETEKEETAAIVPVPGCGHGCHHHCCGAFVQHWHHYHYPQAWTSTAAAVPLTNTYQINPGISWSST